MAFLTQGGSQIGSANIVDGSIVNADINAAAAIAISKLSGVAASGENTDITSINSLITRTVTVTAAQIKAFLATPVELIPAPGANKLIVLMDASAYFIYGTVQYANGGTVTMTYGNGTAITGTSFSNADMIGAASIRKYCPQSSLGSGAQSALLNQNVVIKNTSGGEYITGDSTIRVKLRYYVLDW